MVMTINPVQTEQQQLDFSAIRLRLASPDTIHGWSHGEVLKPEKVIYFASFIITRVDEKLRQETLTQLDGEYEQKKKAIEAEANRQVSEIKKRTLEKKQQPQNDKDGKRVEQEEQEELSSSNAFREEKLKSLREAVDLAKRELQDLQPMRIISEQSYQ